MKTSGETRPQAAIGPARQGLDPGAAAAGQAHDGLVVHLQGLALQRAQQPGRQFFVVEEAEQVAEQQHDAEQQPAADRRGHGRASGLGAKQAAFAEKGDHADVLRRVAQAYLPGADEARPAGPAERLEGLVVVPGETVVDVVAATADGRRRDARVRVVDIEIGVRGNEYDGVAATDQSGGQRLQRQGHALRPEAGAGGIYPVGRGQSPGRAQPAPDARAHDPVAADPANVAHEARLEHDGTQHFQVPVAAGRRAAGVHLAEHLVRRGGNLQCPLQRPLGVRAQVRAVVLAIQFVDDEDPTDTAHQGGGEQYRQDASPVDPAFCSRSTLGHTFFRLMNPWKARQIAEQLHGPCRAVRRTFSDLSRS